MTDNPRDLDREAILELQYEIQQRREEHSKYNPESCEWALRIVNQRTELRLSEEQYEQLRDEKHPSSGTIRNHLRGSWVEIRERVCEG
jgi:hypothetical protein